MTPNITDEQRKQIEQEAEKLYLIDDPRKNMLHDNLGQYSRRDAYILGATTRALACHQKDEEIARLRGLLYGVIHFANGCSSDDAWVEISWELVNQIKEALKPIIP